MTRVAMIGSGYISRVHAQAARATGAEVVAAVNWRPESLAAYAQDLGIARTYPSTMDLLADGDFDAAVICTPNALHAAQALQLLNAGIHVMVEKPMAVSVAEATAMHQVAIYNHRMLMVAHCWRFDAEAQLLRAYVADGDLGRIVRTRGYGLHTHWSPGGWFAQKELSGGGALMDMGVHAIDTVRFLIGDPRPSSVYARISASYGQYNVDDTCMIMIGWEDGATSYIETGWRQPHSDGPTAATQLYGTDGFGQLFPTYLRVRKHGRLTEVRPGFPVRQDHAQPAMYERQMAHFLDSIATGKQPSPGGTEGLEVMRIVDAAYESARSGTVVQLAELTRTA